MSDGVCHALATDVLLWTGRHVVVVVREGRFIVECGLPVDVHLTPCATREEAETLWPRELARAGMTNNGSLFHG